jgi:sugar porter (SP) family MFS transporter
MTGRDAELPAPAGSMPMTPWLWAVAAVIAVAGLLFGYDQGVISGALKGIEDEFAVGTLAVEVITSWVTLGALLGALLAGVLADAIGRKPTLLLAGALFAAGAAVEAAAPGAAILVLGRLVVGFAVGVASVAAPLYAAEMAPTHLRGRYVSIYQLGITLGIFIAYFAAEMVDAAGWRTMLGVSGVVGLALLLSVLPLTDTPRWYLKMGRRAEAEAALRRIDATEEVGGVMREMEATLARDVAASWSEVFADRWRRPLMIGVGLAVFQQITGINAIIYYADRIFGAAGFDSFLDQTRATTWAIGFVNVVATLVAVATIDRLGRKPLLVAGLIGMSASLLVVGFAFRSLAGPAGGEGGASMAGIVTLCALVVYIASFAMSLGPVVWTVINEIYPREVRGRMVSVATAVNWLAAWLVSQFFLSLTEVLGEAGTFWMFAALCLVTVAWVARTVPETKGQSLEEIQHLWEGPAAPR